MAERLISLRIDLDSSKDLSMVSISAPRKSNQPSIRSVQLPSNSNPVKRQSHQSTNGKWDTGRTLVSFLATRGYRGVLASPFGQRSMSHSFLGLVFQHAHPNCLVILPGRSHLGRYIFTQLSFPQISTLRWRLSQSYNLWIPSL